MRGGPVTGQISIGRLFNSPRTIRADRTTQASSVKFKAPDAPKRVIYSDLRQSQAQRGLALSDLSGETYGIQDAATETDLHILSEDLPSVLGSPTYVVFDAISFHIVSSIVYPVSGIQDRRPGKAAL